jgi:hypothetical protein
MALVEAAWTASPERERGFYIWLAAVLGVPAAREWRRLPALRGPVDTAAEAAVNRWQPHTRSSSCLPVTSRVPDG